MDRRRPNDLGPLFKRSRRHVLWPLRMLVVFGGGLVGLTALTGCLFDRNREPGGDPYFMYATVGVARYLSISSNVPNRSGL